MLRLILFLIVNFILGAESGASFSWSQKWQSNKIKGISLQQLPEVIDALMLGFITMEGYRNLGLELSFYEECFFGFVVALIIYAGVQSATWMFLQWEGHSDPSTGRTSTTKPVVDFIAEKLGWKLGDEGYSWVAATVKGTIITLPMGGLGGILFALGCEIGSHAEGRVNKWFNPRIVSEGLSFAGIGLYAWLFLHLTNVVGG